MVGDLHTHWDEVDVAQFDSSDYDLLYFTGDLGGGTPDSTLRIARVMSRLRTPALVMPGNNDTVDINELAAELTHRTGLSRLASMRAGDDSRQSPPADVRLCGYSTHRISQGAIDLTLLAARPHSMGGPDLAFSDYMQATYGIANMQASTERLLALVDEVQTEDLVFLAHNGPTGLGDEPHHMWGCDFKPGGGDWGDPDLNAAIDYARKCGKRVIAVIAGHMHLRTKSGAERDWYGKVDGTVHLNAARVPRIYNRDNDVHRHHVSVIVRRGGVEVREVELAQYGA